MIKEINNYIVTDLGEVINKKSNKFLKIHILKGYKCVYLYINNKRTYKALHRLVAELFILNPNDYKYINHKDGNKLNNSSSNLEWCSAKHNMQHAFSNNLVKTAKKVIQYDLFGNELNKYDSILKACYATQTPAANISACCNKKRKQANDFLWSFA